jgi:hypothetical protein
MHRNYNLQLFKLNYIKEIYWIRVSTDDDYHLVKSAI